MNKNPMILVFAGPNGSGKSTITQYLEKIGTYTNADDVVSATGIDNKKAALLVDESRYSSIEKREDFTFETVLSSQYKLDILNTAKDKGYFIKCIFVLTIDPLVNVGRVETRVAAGGHDVDRDAIIRRYKKSTNHLKQLMEICDILHVYDNTFEPVRIVRKHKDDITIFPNEIWDEEKIISLIEG